LARYLAIDWDHDRLYVVSANVSGGSVRVQRAAAWDEQGSPQSGDAAAAGQRLRDRLKEAKIAAAPVVACLGRERVIIKDIRYPAVPAHEEPAVVRFQAVKELAHAADEVVIDYTPYGEQPASGDRRAVVLIVRKELITRYQQLCAAAGLKLAGVTPRPFGTAACLDRIAGTTVLTPAPEPAGSAVAVVTLGEGWAEFCVSRNGVPLLARNLTPGPALAGEVRRNLAVYSGQAPSQPVRAVYVSGGPDNAALRQRLHEALDLPVHLLDPFAGSEQPDLPPPDRRGAFAGLIGLLHLHGDRKGLPTNLAHPKQPRPPVDPGKKRILTVLGLGVAAVVALGVLGAMELSKLNRKVSEQAVKNAELDRALVGLEDEAKRYKALNDWNERTVVVLDQVYDVTDIFPDPEQSKMRLSTLAIDVMDRGPAAKDKYVAKMSLKGVVGDDYKPVDQLVSLLAAEPHYRPDPKTLTRNTGPDARTGFTQQFVIPRIDIEKRAPEKFVRKIDEAALAREREKAPSRRPERGGP
jgi:Tfp pilus assembly PilM family ATPase